MAGRGGVYRLLILVIAVFAGCSLPLGEAIGGEDTRLYDGLVVKPNREEYELGEQFEQTEEHLKVFTTFKGEQDALSLDECEVIIEDLDSPEKSALVTEKGYLFESSGKKVIHVKYSNLSSQYPIEVLEPAEESGPAGITIEWPS